MTKVCHLTSAHPSNDPRIFHKQCASLAREGYDTYLVARGESREEKGVHVIGVPAEEGSRLQRFLGTTRKVYEAALAVDADIYEFHDPELLPYGLKLKRRGKRVIFDSHEDYPTQILGKQWIPGPPRKLISACYKAYETYVVRRLDAVLFPCTKNGVNIFDGRARETVIISNAVMLQEAAERIPAQQKGRVICCTGSLTRLRGITQLIQAASLAEARLILAGNYESAEYRAQLEAMPEYAAVDYRGYVGREEIAKIYREAAVGMSTILNVGQYSCLDNFPTKVYEYMAAGLPVVVSDYPFLANAARGEGFGIPVDPEDPQAIAAAVRRLLDHPEEADRMGEAGRQAVEQRYNWGIEEQKLFALYRKLAK